MPSSLDLYLQPYVLPTQSMLRWAFVSAAVFFRPASWILVHLRSAWWHWTLASLLSALTMLMFCIQRTSDGECQGVCNGLQWYGEEMVAKWLVVRHLKGVHLPSSGQQHFPCCRTKAARHGGEWQDQVVSTLHQCCGCYVFATVRCWSRHVF